jgi:hypothetical protein
MLLERYEYEADSHFQVYDFFSEGPNGRIKKIVLYTFIRTIDEINYYNLGFGDFDEEERKINDLSVSNNDDRDKVLATVAMTTLEFTEHFPKARIVVEGSTQGRTRLYQMRIAKYYKDISELFDIQGLREGTGWENFTASENYVAFLISRK